jgi:predicted GIY-YIG superfamily endonuclease
MATSYLYRQFDKDGRLLYVGVSGRLAIRLTQHRASPWYGEIDRVETEEFATREEALTAEKKAIERERPEWNVHYGDPSSSRSRQRGTLVVDHGRSFMVGNLTIAKKPRDARSWRLVAAALRQRRLLPDLNHVAAEDLLLHLQAAAVPLAATILPKKRPLVVARTTLPR